MYVQAFRPSCSWNYFFGRKLCLISLLPAPVKPNLSALQPLFLYTCETYLAEQSSKLALCKTLRPLGTLRTPSCQLEEAFVFCTLQNLAPAQSSDACQRFSTLSCLQHCFLLKGILLVHPTLSKIDLATIYTQLLVSTPQWHKCTNISLHSGLTEVGQSCRKFSRKELEPRNRRGTLCRSPQRSAQHRPSASSCRCLDQCRSPLKSTTITPLIVETSQARQNWQCLSRQNWQGLFCRE